MKILLTGSTGLIGSALTTELQNQGHDIVRLIRPPKLPEINDIVWNPAERFIDKSKIRKCDAVIHLAGESIAGRYSKNKRQRIYQSRINGTKLITEFIEALDERPRTFISASAIGYYGDRENMLLTEEAPNGDGFLAQLCRDWEAASREANNLGVRTVQTRFGIVLSRQGGSLAKMLTPFKLGLAGPLANGNQMWPWISIEDTVAAIIFILNTPSLRGPVNVVSPNPVTNSQFTQTLARTLNRPAAIRLPRIAIRTIFGPLAEELLLSSINAVPTKLQNAGFKFKNTDLNETLHDILIRRAKLQ